MKKLLFLLVFNCMGCISFAQQPVEASVSISGSTATIIVENHSSDYLTSLYITVSGENLHIYDEGGTEEWKPVTYYSGKKYFDHPIAPRTSFTFKAKAEVKKDMSYTSMFRNPSISISDPVFSK